MANMNKHFKCTSCSRPCEYVTTDYVLNGKRYIRKGAKLCERCFKTRKNLIRDILTVGKEEILKMVNQ